MEKQKERKLTKQEQIRKEAFETECARLGNEGYEREDLTMGIVAANILAIVIMIPFVILACFFFYGKNGELSFSLNPLNSVLFLFGMIFLIVAHEGIHGLVWGFCCKNRFKSIEFGIVWSMLTPYCACKEPLKKYQYIIGSAMPTVIVGFLPAVIATIINSPNLFALAVILILGGGGDFIIICKLLLHRADGCDVIYIDHPYELGVVAFKKLK